MQVNHLAPAANSELVHLILQSGLFAIEYYREQIGNSGNELSDKELVMHYLEIGQELGLKPNELFDPEWYAQENTDVSTHATSLFAHYVTNGEVEGRSPHPLFDVAYYRSKAQEPIRRPLSHYINTKGRSGLNPHLLINTENFLQFFAGKIDDNTDPLSYIVRHPEAKEYFKDCFSGTYYAKQLKEVYDEKRHNISEFLKRTAREHVSPHPGFDLEAYIAHNPDVAKARMNGYVHYIHFGLRENRGPSLVKDYSRRSITFKTDPGSIGPIVGEKSSRSFEGDYRTQEVELPRPIKHPEPIHLNSENMNALRIDERRTHVLEEVSSRLRLDWPKLSEIPTTALPLISILMPVYKPPLVFLDRAIRSVLQQSYPNWELCIVDDGSEDENLLRMLSQYATHYPNIRFRRALNNGGISRATNAALEISNGTFVALLDNDDMLTYDAIHQITHTILQNTEADFIYSDECIIDRNDRAVNLFSKPDWSPVNLLSCMYTGHFSVYRKTLVEAVGGFRSDYDFSQDYDLALRVSEKAISIIHLRAYIYGWRMIEGSAAQGGKPFARFTNVAALQDALVRRGYPGLALGLPDSNVATRNTAADQPLVSIIIPSDNVSNILNSIASILTKTSYPNIEIIVVTNSMIAARIERSNFAKTVTLARYNRPFNFSDKCNEGAAQATGEFIIFYNDDVRVLKENWIDALLDYAILDGVGAVAPKLLYEDGTIQHAGMVTGVRRLVGTAFHSYPATTSEHFGTAQYTREVSLLCGACIMVSSRIFHELKGFDAVNVPINHSDVDLCFRIREKGLSCVYVPNSCLLHIGHVSIGETEKIISSHANKDKADIFLLKRWAEQISFDPYFPTAMRDLIYKDSQEPFSLYPGTRAKRRIGTKDVLIISHDLTNSGAPRVVFDLSQILRSADFYVCVVSPVDGPMRRRLVESGVDVIIDSLLFCNNSNNFDFAKNFDFAIANTAVSWPFVSQMKDTLPIYWYIHESSLLNHLAAIVPYFADCFRGIAGVWAGSGKSAEYLARHGILDAHVVPYGVIESDLPSQLYGIDHQNRDQPISVGVFGSVEPRKGQDLAVLGFLELPQAHRNTLELRLFGRTLDPTFADAVRNLAKSSKSILIKGEVGEAAYLEELSKVDVVLVPSRDDTLPLVSLDALSLGKILIVSRTTGTSDWLEDGVSAYILEHNSPTEISSVLQRIVSEPQSWSTIRKNARNCFDINFSWHSYVQRILDLIGSQSKDTER